MAKEDKRFIKTYSQNSFGASIEIWVDKETGVNYIHKSSGYGGGFTPLLDAHGNVVVTKIYEE